MHNGRLSERLRQQIEDWSNELLCTSPLLARTRRGELSPDALASYLGSLGYLFERSEQNLRHAATRASELGLPALRDYLLQKAREEQGHSRWAERDLASLPEPARAHAAPTRELLRLVELQRQLIARHPICFVAYALWAEYFTVLVGEEWLAALSRSGFGRERVSAVARHVEADGAHAALALAVIDTLWTGDPPLTVITDGVNDACHTFSRFCLEICEIGTHAA